MNEELENLRLEALEEDEQDARDRELALLEKSAWADREAEAREWAA